MPNKTEYLTIDQFFDHLKGEAIAKKGSKMEDGVTLKFALPIGGSLEGIPVFKTDETLNEFLTKTYINDTQYMLYGIKDGKTTQVK